MKNFFIILLLFCHQTFAQQQVQGIVLNGTDSSKLIAASVFINTSSIGTITGDDGKFILRGINVTNFQLIISYVGFTPVSININPENINQFHIIKLFPRKRSLEDITIMPVDKNGWKKWGTQFTRLFIGTSYFAEDCKIENPGVIRFYQNKKTGVLHAYSETPITIRNKDLGYNIKYLLENFTFDPKTRGMLYMGYSVYEDLSKKNNNKMKKWIRNRHLVYAGSILHFIRAVYNNSVKTQGFDVRDKIRIYSGDSAFNQIYRGGNLAQFVKIHDTIYTVSVGFSDTAMKQADYVDLIDTVEFSLKNLVKFDASKSQKTFYFDNYLDVRYHTPPYKSEITLDTNEPLVIDESGLYFDPANLITSGHWADQRMAETLPFDYVDKNE
ncbi:MAG TPA: carboxypeptidase-like regulatory domain-containing protein [Ginsengibacter sp.]|nr:carboxypeptidase-like regulatory domain-containing protein [Ginsengibacter sp.]